MSQAPADPQRRPLPPAELAEAARWADQFPHPTWVTTPAGETVHLSPRFAALTGVPGGDWLAAVPPADRDAAGRAFRAFLAGDAPFAHRHRLTGPAGGPLFAESRAERLTAPESLRGWVLGTTAVRQSAGIWQEMGEGFCVVEVLFDDAGRATDHRFLEVNAAFARQTGLADVVGRRATELVPDLEPVWHKLYGRVALTGESARFTHVAQALDARVFELYAFRMNAPEDRQVAVLFTDISHRPSAQKTIADSRAMLQTVVDSLPALVGYVGRDLNYRFLNRAYETWFGRSPPELVGRNVRDVFTEAEFEERRPHVEAALRGESVRFESPTTHAALGRRHVEVVYSPHRVGPEIDGVFVHGVDVTERRLAETALRGAEARLTLAIEIAQLGTFDVDLADRTVAVNEPGRAILGWPGPGATLDRLRGQFHPADLPGLERRFLRALDPDHTDTFEGEPRVVRADGQTRWLRLRGRVLFEDAGQPRRATRCLGAFLDISEQRRAAEKLEASERQFREIADTAPATLWITDPAGACTFISREWEAFTGQPVGDALGTGWFQMVHPDDIADAGRNFAVANAARTPFRHDYRLRTRSGTYRWAVDIGRPRYGPGGDYLGMVGAVLDLEDAKQAEAALKNADRRKDDFLALLAHELRNPLAPIRNGLQVLRLAGHDPVACGKVRDMMDRQVGHMVRLIDDLLDISRIGRNKMELRRQAIFLSEVVRNAVETAMPALDAAGHRLAVRLPDEPVPLDADPTRLAQVFANLLTNSAKYTPPGGEISLTATATEAAVEVAVCDNGIGIPAASLGKIFDMFSQVDRSVERSTGGLGIGLALVKGLVEMHGGQVSAASPGPDRGSTFRVTLPRPARAESAAPTAVADAASKAGGCRVLVAEDDRDSAVSMGAMLQLLGHTVWVAHDGLEAVAAAERHRPQVVLMDIGMPRLDGYEAIRRIRSAPWGAGLVLVALTGRGQDGDRTRSRAAGCDGHLVKPVCLADLEPYLRLPVPPPA